jgi:hypothetical protein
MRALSTPMPKDDTIRARVPENPLLRDLDNYTAHIDDNGQINNNFAYPSSFPLLCEGVDFLVTRSTRKQVCIDPHWFLNMRCHQS